MFWEGLQKDFESWTRKTTGCWELSGMFCERMADNNVESIAADGGLACEVSERSLKTQQASLEELNDRKGNRINMTAGQGTLN